MNGRVPPSPGEPDLVTHGRYERPPFPFPFSFPFPGPFPFMLLFMSPPHISHLAVLQRLVELRDRPDRPSSIPTFDGFFIPEPSTIALRVVDAMADHRLRCNSLNCRTSLTEKAVVTTCSHIFCVSCAKHLHLFTVEARERRCPACTEALPNPDDAVTTLLNPTEDYKTSVLSGLDPNTIMECAGRALAFWTYQTTQEIIYQQWLGKGLTEKYTALSSQMDQLVKDANLEIESCRRKIEELKLDNKQLHNQKEEIRTQLQVKSKQQAQTRRLYDQLKGKVRATDVSAAALQSADLIASSRPEGLRAEAHLNDVPAAALPGTSYTLPVSNESVYDVNAGSGHHRFETGRVHNGDYAAMPPPQRPTQDPCSNPPTASTPQHRSQLPGPLRSAAARSHIPQSTAHLSTPPSARRANSSASARRHSQSRGSGYGISAGMKVGTTPMPRLGVPQSAGYAFRDSPHNLTNGLANGLGGAFATGPRFPGNYFS